MAFPAAAILRTCALMEVNFFMVLNGLNLQCGQSSVLPKTWGIEGCLEHCIDRPLEQFQAKNNASEDSNAIHYSVLELFE